LCGIVVQINLLVPPAVSVGSVFGKAFRSPKGFACLSIDRDCVAARTVVVPDRVVLLETALLLFLSGGPPTLILLNASEAVRPK
jgi:hypothetical protein